MLPRPPDRGPGPAASAGRKAGKGTDAEDEARNHLEEKRQPPGPVGRNLPREKRGPERDHDTDTDAELLQHEQSTAHIGRTDLGNIQRHHHAQHPNLHPIDEARCGKEGVARSCGLQDGAGGEDSDDEKDGV